MKLAYYIKKESLVADPRVRSLLKELGDNGMEVYRVASPEDVSGQTDILLSIGGDGTLLSAAGIAVPNDLAVLGVNFGRLGFLSETAPEELVEALRKGEFLVEERELLQVVPDAAEKLSAQTERFWPYALNEVSVSRVSASMLGVDVCVDGSPLPTYWADGMLVATSSGSTAYSLSVGGPICTPDSGVLIIAPISPHNLNVRPLVVPLDSNISISLRSRDDSAVLSLDNRTYTVDAGVRLEISAAPVRLKCMRPAKSNFINALRARLHWGEDVRNDAENL